MPGGPTRTFALEAQLLVVPDLDAEAYRGFPICTATLRYHGQGINAIMGWVQLITREFDGDVAVDALFRQGVDAIAAMLHLQARQQRNLIPLAAFPSH